MKKIVKSQAFVLETVFSIASSSVLYSVSGSFSGAFFFYRTFYSNNRNADVSSSGSIFPEEIKSSTDEGGN